MVIRTLLEPSMLATSNGRWMMASNISKAAIVILVSMHFLETLENITCC